MKISKHNKQMKISMSIIFQPKAAIQKKNCMLVYIEAMYNVISLFQGKLKFNFKNGL